jgi:sugar diacid utilization regulator
MPGDDIQPVVDALAARLGRSVAVDDPEMHLIAATRHFGDEDPVRVRSVLDRSVPPDIERWITAQGVTRWSGPGRIDSNPELEADARVCAPVRCNGMLLGYLWLIDPGSEIDDDDMRAVADAADAIGIILYRRMLLHERERTRTESLLRLLLSLEPEDRNHAIAEIQDDELLASTGHVVVLVAETEDVPGQDASVALETGVEHVRRTLPPRSTLAFVQHRRAVVVITSPRPVTNHLAHDVARRLHERITELTGTQHRCAIGIGAPRSGLEHVVHAYREAGTAVRAALLLPMFGDIAAWPELGPFALLLRIDFDQLTQELPFPGVRDLFADPANDVLVSSVEEFLDRAGDVSATADAMHVHRTTIYHRLHRIETLTGLSLNNGLDRLTLHLAVKLSRINAARHNGSIP